MIGSSDERQSCADYPFWDDYFVKRMETLKRYAIDASSIGPILSVDYADLIGSTATILDKISTWLGLPNLFSVTYSALPTTGQIGYGDPSHNIRAGRILANHERRRYVLHDFVDLSRSRRAYTDTRKKLAELATLL